MKRAMSRHVAWAAPLGLIVGYLCADDHPHALMSPMVEMVIGGAVGVLVAAVIAWRVSGGGEAGG